VSARDPKLAALSHLNHARDEAVRAVRELMDVKQGLGLLGLEAGGIERVVDAISMTLDRIHVARCVLWDAASDEMRSRPCA